MADESFAVIDTSAWPVVVIRYSHANPSAEEQATYFSHFSDILNERATISHPCAIVFDASGIPLARMFDISLTFFGVHNDFNKAYYERFNAVCSGFGIIVSQPMFRGLIKTAISFAPPSHTCKDFTNVEEAIKALAPTTRATSVTNA